MTLQAAMNFLDAIRERAELEATLTGARSYEDLAQAGAQHGFIFTAEALDQAFRHRCVMLQLHRGAAHSDQSASTVQQRPAGCKDDHIVVVGSIG